MTTVYDFSATAIDGTEKDLADFRGKALLIVNTATQCGFTPQFEGLEKLHRDYEGRGLVVLGFPSDQFMHQNPESDAETAEFCQRNYGVTFPLFSRIDVNGDNTHPLYQWLKSEKRGLGPAAIKWNFTKFLVNPEGQVVKRFGSATAPDKLVGDIEDVLPDEG